MANFALYLCLFSVMQSVYCPALHMIIVQPMSHSDQCCQMLFESVQTVIILCLAFSAMSCNATVSVA